MKTFKAWLPAILWMGVIFMMSAAPGEVSGEQSGLVLRVLLAMYGFFFGGAQPTPDTLATLEFLVRKAAHMSEYAVLALTYLYALHKTNAKRPFFTALALAALYAASDEFHQAFVPDRGPSPVDVMIDTVGASFGLVFAALFVKFRKPTT